MIKKLLLLAAATLALSSCNEPQHRRHHSSAHKVAPVHHFPNGSWGYQDDSGDWYIYYLIATQNSTPTLYTYPSYSTGGIWTKAATPPTAKEIAEATTEEAEIEVGPDGEPVETAEEQATAAETEANEVAADADNGNEPADAGTDNGGDNGGGGDAGGGDTGGGGDAGGGDAGGGGGE